VDIKQELVTLAQNPKVAASVSIMTTGTGAGTVLDWIPDDIGKLASVFGIILSAILTRMYLLSVKKLKLELEVLEERKRQRSNNG